GAATRSSACELPVRPRRTALRRPFAGLQDRRLSSSAPTIPSAPATEWQRPPRVASCPPRAKPHNQRRCEAFLPGPRGPSLESPAPGSPPEGTPPSSLGIRPRSRRSPAGRAQSESPATLRPTRNRGEKRCLWATPLHRPLIQLSDWIIWTLRSEATSGSGAYSSEE